MLLSEGAVVLLLLAFGVEHARQGRLRNRFGIDWMVIHEWPMGGAAATGFVLGVVKREKTFDLDRSGVVAMCLLMMGRTCWIVIRTTSNPD